MLDVFLTSSKKKKMYQDRSATERTIGSTTVTYFPERTTDGNCIRRKSRGPAKRYPRTLLAKRVSEDAARVIGFVMKSDQARERFGRKKHEIGVL